MEFGSFVATAPLSTLVLPAIVSTALILSFHPRAQHHLVELFSPPLHVSGLTGQRRRTPRIVWALTLRSPSGSYVLFIPSSTSRMERRFFRRRIAGQTAKVMLPSSCMVEKTARCGDSAMALSTGSDRARHQRCMLALFSVCRTVLLIWGNSQSPDNSAADPGRLQGLGSAFQGRQQRLQLFARSITR